jgi:hypothetical protein
VTASLPSLSHVDWLPNLDLGVGLNAMERRYLRNLPPSDGKPYCTFFYLMFNLHPDHDRHSVEPRTPAAEEDAERTDGDYQIDAADNAQADGNAEDADEAGIFLVQSSYLTSAARS